MSRNSLLGWLGLGVALPALYFVTGSILKYELHLLDTVEIYVFPPWVLIGGLTLALLLNGSTLIPWNRQSDACTRSIFNRVIALASGLCLLVLLLYVIVENLSEHS